MIVITAHLSPKKSSSSLKDSTSALFWSAQALQALFILINITFNSLDVIIGKFFTNINDSVSKKRDVIYLAVTTVRDDRIRCEIRTARMIDEPWHATCMLTINSMVFCAWNIKLIQVEEISRAFLVIYPRTARWFSRPDDFSVILFDEGSPWKLFGAAETFSNVKFQSPRFHLPGKIMLYSPQPLAPAQKISKGTLRPRCTTRLRQSIPQWQPWWHSKIGFWLLRPSLKIPGRL